MKIQKTILTAVAALLTGGFVACNSVAAVEEAPEAKPEVAMKKCNHASGEKGGCSMKDGKKKCNHASGEKGSCLMKDGKKHEGCSMKAGEAGMKKCAHKDGKAGMKKCAHKDGKAGMKKCAHKNGKAGMKKCAHKDGKAGGCSMKAGKKSACKGGECSKKKVAEAAAAVENKVQ